MPLQIDNGITVHTTIWIFMSIFSLVASILIAVSNTVTIIVLVSIVVILISFAIPTTHLINLSLVFFSLGTLFISLTTFRLGGEFFNASDLFYLISSILLIIYLIIAKESLYMVFIKGNPLLTPLLLLVIGGVLSMFNSSTTELNATALGKFIFLFGVWLPVAIYLHDSETKTKFLLIMVAVAALLPILSCLSDYFMHTRITSYLNHMLKLNIESPDKIIFSRFGSVMGHPNNFASLLVVVFPISLWLILFARSLCFKLCSVGFLIGVVISLLICGSRASLVAIFAQIIIFYALLLRKRWMSFIVVLTLGIMLMLNLQYISDYFPQSPIKRIATMITFDLGQYRPDINRVSSLEQAVGFIMEHPISGVGIGHAAKMTDKVYVHNTLFRFWASVGVFGLVAFLWLCGKPLYLGFVKMHHLFKDDYEQRMILVTILCAVTGSFIFDMFAPQFQSRFKWICVAILFSMWNIKSRKETILKGDSRCVTSNEL
jgi:O-antigen ligase